jgi:hypothetical protein
VQAEAATLYTAVAWGPGEKPGDVRSDGDGYVTFSAPGGGYCYWRRAEGSYRSAYTNVYVPGDNADVFGTGWYFGEANRMSLVDDYTWRWVSNSGEATSVEYKFAMDGSWDLNRGLGDTSGPTLPQKNSSLVQGGGNMPVNLSRGICVWEYREDSETSRIFTVDFNGDGSVDIADTAVIGRYWLRENCGGDGWCGGTDVDMSGSVGAGDLAEFVEYWLFDVDGD